MAPGGTLRGLGGSAGDGGVAPSDQIRPKTASTASEATILCFVVSVQGVQVDPDARRAWRDGVEIRLSKKEFDLLHALIRRAGEIVTRDELMREVWHTTFWTSGKTIDVHLGWLRRKLGDDTRNPQLISTIRGRGLRFEVGDVSAEDSKAS